MTQNGYILSIDGGGTKTEAYCMSLDGGYFKKYLTEGSNWSVYGERGLKVVEDLILTVCGDLNIRPEQLSGLALGLAGYAADLPKQKLIEMLKRHECEEQSWLVADALLALYSIFKLEPGMVIVSGTGSICMGKDKKGTIYRSGGYGWLVGDEGSGFWLGQNAMKRSLMLLDKDTANGSSLIAHICKTLHVDTLQDGARKITTSEEPHSMIAGLATAVTRAVKEGDELAGEIVREGGEQLANTVLQLCEKMGIDSDVLSIGYMGSVIENLDELRESIESVLLLSFNRIEWKKPAVRAAGGGIYYLYEKLDLPVTDSVEKAVHNK